VSYSNSNYVVLGMIIEAAAGADVASAIRRRLLEPHGLRQTFFGWADALPRPLVHGHTGDIDWAPLPRTSSYSASWTAAGMVAAPQDLARWARLLYGGHVLSEASMATMFDVSPGAASFGGNRRDEVLGQGQAFVGGGAGFSAVALYLPRAQVAVALTINDDLDVIRWGVVELTYRAILDGLAEDVLPRFPQGFADVPRIDQILLDDAALGQTSASGGAQAMVMFGYRALRLAIHPGDAAGSTLRLKVGDKSVVILGSGGDDAYRLDLDRKEWQVLEIPLHRILGRLGESTITSFGLTGNLGGTLYIDDVRLVAADAPPAPPTAVVESYQAGAPDAFRLQQNYPNPFNSSTVIPMELAREAHVTLTIHNLAGQTLATLIDNARPAGAYQLHWDGRDAAGRSLASGHYLYRLQAGNVVQSHKLLLLR
jgi:hypothetical protein